MKVQSNSSSSIVSRIANYENLLWAWNKAKGAYRVGDIWFDTLELADFEANIHLRLVQIKQELFDGTFQLTPLKPLPYPKGEKELENGTIETKVRQTFYISVKDQVVWLAVVNIIGPTLDFEMPFWSYGNRLYHSIWYEDVEKDGKWIKTLKTGWYRRSTKNIYRAWKQSWPLFRHTISLTIKKMSNACTDDYSEQEKEMEENNELLPDKFVASYLQKGYWNIDEYNNVTELFWASIDFEKFYPNVKIESIRQNIMQFGGDVKGDTLFEQLLTQLTTFRVTVDDTWTDEHVEAINLNIDSERIFHGVPTGLYVAGFLANVALIAVDKQIAEKLNSNKRIAHFRYVDDHVVIGYDFDELCLWINEYEKLIDESQIGAKINIQKTEPKTVADYLNSYCNGCEHNNDECVLKAKAKSICKLDPNFPSPLVTQTLTKVSAIADCDMDFLTEHEERQLISDLEHLLTTDFPEHELKSDTRISFAATMLSSIMQRRRMNYSEVHEIRQKIFQLTKEFEAIKRNDKKLREHSKRLVTKYIFGNLDAGSITFPVEHSYPEDPNRKIKEIEEQYSKLVQKVKDIEIYALNQKLHVFKLLVKATKENHDKVKLWCRLFDYCYNTGISSYPNDNNSLITILESIDEVYKRRKSHKLSNDFLASQFVLVLSDRLINALYTIINSDDDLRLKNAKCFIRACLDNTLLSKIFEKENASNMEYYKTSFKYLRISLGTAVFITESNCIKDYDLLDWKNSPQEWCREHNVNLDRYLYYLMYRLNDKSSTDSFPQWGFMANISQNTEAFLTPFSPVDYRRETDTNQDMITLYEWIQECGVMANNPDYIYDPRLSEWIALKIVDRLIDIHEKPLTAEHFLTDDRLDFDTKIHPSNYYIPREWIEDRSAKGWGYYRAFNFDEITYQKDGAISDPRYTPKGLDLAYDTENGDFSSIYGFAVILCQLICHDTKFPWIWNVDDKNIESSNYIFANTKSTTISSFSKAILLGSTLSRSRESFSLKQIFNELSANRISDDSNNDPPQIVSLSDLKNYIQKAISELEMLQTSVGEDKPRQMIPVRLERITKNQPF